MMYNKQKLACDKEKPNTALRVKDNRKFEFQMRKGKSVIESHVSRVSATQKLQVSVTLAGFLMFRLHANYKRSSQREQYQY